ncbi:MAG: glycoside hydrolase family 16 protein [Bacteroidaceae bacterium]|nr:glycoside hydrolase family 16 protein [Bacteroidaceae bacterium]
MKQMRNGMVVATVLSVMSLCPRTVWAATEDVDTIAGYRLVWHDEFETEGSYGAHWKPEEGFVRNKELQWYQGENARVKDGCLVIAGRKETVANPNYKEDGKDWKTNRKEAHYTSASLTTSESFTFKYGRVLVRAKMPSVWGSWPAIWLKGNMWEWPYKGEIDMMEYYPSKGEPCLHANACWGGKERFASVWDSEAVPISHFSERDPEWAHKFHVWRMDWDKAWIRLYVDDELLNEIDLSKTFNQGYDGNYENPFSNDIDGFGVHLLLNLAIGSTGGTPADDAFPIHYLVDYVRVYQAAE